MNEECSKTASSDADNTINIGDETKKTLNRDCFCSPSKATSNGRGESSCFDYHAKLIMKMKIWFRYTQTETQTQYVIAIYLRHINRNHTLKMHLSLTFTNLQLKQPENETEPPLYNVKRKLRITSVLVLHI